jgi:sugar lactone lactonase YvrE
MNPLMNFEFAKRVHQLSRKQGTTAMDCQAKEKYVTSKRFSWSVVGGGWAFEGWSIRKACCALVATGIALLPMQSFAQQQLSPVWVLSTLAGTGATTADSGNNGPALKAVLGKPYSVARDKLGNIYVSGANQTVRKIDTNGNITTIAGTSGTAGYSGDGGPATKALLNNPYGLALDINGNLLIADTSNDIIRRVDLTTGIITTIAGTPKTQGYGGDGYPATDARVKLYAPFTVTTDLAGNLYIADYDNFRIRKIDTKGTITTFAGKGTNGNTGDGGPATQAQFQPWTVVADMTGDVYIADNVHNVVRMVDPSGIIHTVAGSGTVCAISGTGSTPTCLDGGPATSAHLDAPHGFATDGMGNFYFPDENTHDIRGVNPAGIINKIAGTYGKGGFVGDGGPANAGTLWYPYSVIIDSSNNLYVPDASNGRVRELSLNTNLPSTAVGSSVTQKLFVQSTSAVTPDAATVSPASLPAQFSVGMFTGCTLGQQLAANTPCTVPITFQPTAPGLQSSELAFTDVSGTVSTIGLNGVGVAPAVTFSLAGISTIAGTGTAGNAGVSGPAASAQVSAPRGGVFDSAGNLYFADSGNNIIRRIDAASGAISTVAGIGSAAYSGDNAAATSAELNAPSKVVLDAAGNLYIADTGNNRIRYVSAATGIITTIAGNGTADYKGDGGPATAATLDRPQGLALDLGGHVYVADTGNNVIRWFGPGGNITTLVGTGVAGDSGDGSNAHGAALNAPQAVALDQSGDIYIADTGNDVVREVSVTNNISTIAGQKNNAVNAGDGGTAQAASLNSPSDLALDAAGDLYIAAQDQVRMVNAAGIISTLVGTSGSGSYSGEGGAATSAVLPSPVSNLMLDSSANIVLADTAANRLLKVASATPMPLNLGTQAAGTTATTPTVFLVQNVGNSALNLSGIASTTGFTIQTGDASACTTTTSLAAGQSCSISLLLSPPASANGAVSGTLTLVDNTLNGTGVTQIFALAGATKSITPTTTTVSVSPISVVYGSPATITATINNGNSLTGTMSFVANGTSIGNVPVNNGAATLALPGLSTGTVNISATYSGDQNNSSSTGMGSVRITPALLTVKAVNATMAQGTTPPTLTYVASGFVNGDTSSVLTGEPTETTTASPSSQQGSTYPITITQGTLTARNYTFTFVNATMTVGPPPTPDFLLSATPTTVSITAGQPYIATVTLIPLYNYKGTATISCTSVPQGLGCVASGTLTGGGGLLTGNAQGSPVWTQITISGHNSSSASILPVQSQRLWFAFGMPISFLGLAFWKRRKGKWVARLLSFAVLVVAAAGVSSCGKGSSSFAPAGTYQVTITATDTASGPSHSTTLSLTYR